MNVHLERVELPALAQTSASDGGSSRSGNNDKGRRLQANRARTCWRLVETDGTWTETGLFVDKDHARTFAAERGWTVR